MYLLTLILASLQDFLARFLSLGIGITATLPRVSIQRSHRLGTLHYTRSSIIVSYLTPGSC